MVPSHITKREIMHTENITYQKQSTVEQNNVHLYIPYLPHSSLMSSNISSYSSSSASASAVIAYIIQKQTIISYNKFIQNQDRSLWSNSILPPNHVSFLIIYNPLFGIWIRQGNRSYSIYEILLYKSTILYPFLLFQIYISSLVRTSSF